ncbi:MAG: hypothetical protein R2712_14045 [Vicinamibacterales bacterium]
MRNLRMRQQVLGGRHDLGDTTLVVGAEQRRPRRGDDVVAEALAEIGGVGNPEDRRGVVRQDQVSSVVGPVDDGVTPAPLISGDVSTWAMKPMTGMPGLEEVAGIVAMT